LGKGLKLLTIKNQLLMKCYPGPWNLMDSLEPKQWKMDMRFGICNVRDLYRAASLKTEACELAKYNI
jgi:hypothetical protein